MKFTLSSTTLSNKLAILSKVLMSKNAMVILDGFCEEFFRFVILAVDHHHFFSFVHVVP